MTDNPLLTAALEYASYGWPVLPCLAKAKAPHTRNGVNDATTDPDTIRAYWTRWPDANIGMACGVGDGPHGIDIDLDPEKKVDGWASLKLFPDLPLTIRQDTPRGGAHFLYSGKPPKKKNGFRVGIDIRTGGWYVLLPPSIHPNGKAYAWTPGFGPGEIALADFPDFMRPENEKPARSPWDPPENSPTPTARKAPTRPGATPIMERARLYLQECEPATQGHGGHDALLWAARALVIGFELSDSEALVLLWNDFNPRCNPPWDPAKSGDTKDFERKVFEARKTPGEKPSGWLLDELGLRGHDEALFALGSRIAEGLLADYREKAKAKAVAVAEGRPLVIAQRRIVAARTIPEWLLNPRGMAGQLSNHINRTAGCYQPLLAVGASLVACGAIMGRKLRDSSNGRTNLYMMGVAHSSAGKDHPGKVIRSIIQAAGAAAILGGSRITSDTAIEMALQAFLVQLFTFDEAGHFLAAIKQAGIGSGGASHLRTIVPALMELYSTAGGLYIGKQKADGELRKFDQPHVCIWSLTSPDILYRALSSDELKDGWLGRVITLISEDRPRYKFTEITLDPEAVVSIMAAWHTRNIPAPEGEGNIQSVLSCHQHTAPDQPAGRKLLMEFGDECYDRMLVCDKHDDPTQYLWGKALENARKVALTVAGSEYYDGTEITEYHARYGCDFVRWNTERFADAVRDNISDNVFEKDKQTILKVLTKAGRAGMPKADFTRATQQFKDKKVRDAYLADLIEAGLVVSGMHPEHPEVRAGWLWAAPYGLDLFTNKEDAA